MSKKLAALGLLAALLLAAAVAHGEEISGTFQIYADGKVAGAEKFSINFENDGQVTSESQGALKQGNAETRDFTRLILRTLSGPIHTYQREAVLDRLPRALGATNENGVLHIENHQGPQKKDTYLNISPSTVVVDVGVWHHLHLLIHRYSHRIGGEQSFTIVIPSELRLVDDVTLRHIGREPVALENGWFMAHKYFLNRHDIGMIIWADTKGQIIKIDSPMQGYSVVRMKYDGERASEINPVSTVNSDLIYEQVEIAADPKLAGVLTKPRGLPGRLPAVIFLGDGGKIDRDGMSLALNVNIGTAEMLDPISHSGFAVLRVDARGVRGSEGDITQTTLSVREKDAEALLDYLKTRPDIDANRIAIAGQGEGANVAIMTAAARHDIKALVLLAPCDAPFSRLAEEQTKHRLTLDGGDPNDWTTSAVANLMRMARDKPDQKTFLVAGRLIHLDYYREWFAMHPVDDLQKSTANILHVQPAKDLQVFPHFADGFRKALGAEKRYTFKVFDSLNHFFKPSKGTIGEYADPSAKVDPAFVAYVGDWLKANL
jgi:dienelactone hydrolase